MSTFGDSVGEWKTVNLLPFFQSLHGTFFLVVTGGMMFGAFGNGWAH